MSAKHCCSAVLRVTVSPCVSSETDFKTTKVRGCSYSQQLCSHGRPLFHQQPHEGSDFHARQLMCVQTPWATLCRLLQPARMSPASYLLPAPPVQARLQECSYSSCPRQAQLTTPGPAPMSCAFAETGAAALASAAGDAILRVVGKCGAVAGWMKSGQLAAAFTDVTTAAFTKACTSGKGPASRPRRAALGVWLNHCPRFWSELWQQLAAVAVSATAHPS